MNDARAKIDTIFAQFAELNGSDLYLTVGRPPCARVADQLRQLNNTALEEWDLEDIINEILPDDKREEFYSNMEYNMSLQWNKKVRFRINMFRQQRYCALVARRVQTNIPTLDFLKLPQIYKDMVMEKRGLVLIAGPTGSGKSTSLAAMIEYRNRNSCGHIVTVEDPIEFIHPHQNCIVTQRDVGIDTHSYSMALKNVLRQRPDVVLIGEIRDRETMEQALHFSETGHLCLSTLHAGTVLQTLERILNFFPEEQHRQVCYNLASNLRGILSQRLILSTDNNRQLALETMINRGHITTLIRDNQMKGINEVMAKNRGEGMATFEQTIFDLYVSGKITEEVAVGESHNPANIRLLIRQHQTTRVAFPALRNTNNNSF